MQVGNGYFADWHQMLKRFHRGDIIDMFVGRNIDIIAGFAALYLTISGWVMFFEMCKRRSRLGCSGWFWK